MYFLMYHGQPESNSGNVAGAYINCYIQADNIDKADKIARKGIKELLWNILNKEKAYEIDVESMSNDGRGYYEQALIDKTVYVFHTYPIDENDN